MNIKIRLNNLLKANILWGKLSNQEHVSKLFLDREGLVCALKNENLMVFCSQSTKSFLILKEIVSSQQYILSIDSTEEYQQTKVYKNLTQTIKEKDNGYVKENSTNEKKSIFDSFLMNLVKGFNHISETITRLFNPFVDLNQKYISNAYQENKQHYNWFKEIKTYPFKKYKTDLDLSSIEKEIKKLEKGLFNQTSSAGYYNNSTNNKNYALRINSESELLELYIVLLNADLKDDNLKNSVEIDNSFLSKIVFKQKEFEEKEINIKSLNINNNSLFDLNLDLKQIDMEDFSFTHNSLMNVDIQLKNNVNKKIKNTLLGNVNVKCD